MSSQRLQPVDTPSNHGPIVSVVTWFLLAATVLAVLARVVTKLFVSKRLTSDDLLIFIALVSCDLSPVPAQSLKPPGAEHRPRRCRQLANIEWTGPARISFVRLPA